MAEPHWTSYVAIVTGSIGALTGIAGAIMGYIGYRNSKFIKAQDLRLELRKAVTDVEIELPQLKELLAYADKSRNAVASATGMRGSGAMVLWKQQLESDQAKLQQLMEQAPSSTRNYEKLSLIELESELVAIHKLKVQIDNLRDKYKSSLEADDKQREQIAEGIRSLTRS